MNNSLKLIAFLILIVFASCTVDTESHTVKTSNIDLKANGPFYQGMNSLTATWNYKLDELLPEIEGDITIENARVTTVKIVPKPNVDYPNIGDFIMQMKVKNQSMSRIGLMESNFKKNQSNSLWVSQIQDDFHKDFKYGQVTFKADFELLDEKYDDDLNYDLIVTFKIQTRK